MAWNPFRAIGSAIGNAGNAIGNAVRGIFERETPTPEQAPTPAPTAPETPIVEQAPPPEPIVQEAPSSEERGIFGSIRDFVTGLFERESEAPIPEPVQEAPREPVVEGVQEIEQAPSVEQVEEVEQAPISEPTVAEEELETGQAPTEQTVTEEPTYPSEAPTFEPTVPEEVETGQAPTLEPTVPEVAPVEPGVPAEEEPLLPKFIEETPASSYTERDNIAFGADSDFTRDLNEAVANFIAERGGLEGLSQSAQEWLLSATISEIFDKYWDNPAGFSAEDVLKNMQSITDIRIRELDDGSIEVEFDYDSDDGSTSGHVAGHAHASR